jgi:hypothetical protein
VVLRPHPRKYVPCWKTRYESEVGPV